MKLSLNHRKAEEHTATNTINKGSKCHLRLFKFYVIFSVSCKGFLGAGALLPIFYQMIFSPGILHSIQQNLQSILSVVTPPCSKSRSGSRGYSTKNY